MFWSTNVIIWFTLKVSLNSNVLMWYTEKESATRQPAASYPVQRKDSLCRQVKKAVLCTCIHAPAYAVCIKHLSFLQMVYDTITYIDSSGRRFPLPRSEGVMSVGRCPAPAPTRPPTGLPTAPRCCVWWGQGNRAVPQCCPGMPLKCVSNWASPVTVPVYTLFCRARSWVSGPVLLCLDVVYIQQCKQLDAWVHKYRAGQDLARFFISPGGVASKAVWFAVETTASVGCHQNHSCYIVEKTGSSPNFL